MSDQATPAPTHAARIADLERRMDRLQQAFADWRHGQANVQHLDEEARFLAEIDHLRRRLDAARAAPGDQRDRMRLLDNWTPASGSAAAFHYDTPGGYRLTQNDVTQVWLAGTPDGRLQGPFPDAQAAADWCADDWAGDTWEPGGS